MKVLVTGGCGFIGSNFIDFLLKDQPEVQIANLDLQTYAGQGKNVEHMGHSTDRRYTFIYGDIAKKSDVAPVFMDYRPDMVVNFAAESHVDRSIRNSAPFVSSNVTGAVNLMDAALESDCSRFVQISTDEVYGSRKTGSFSEKDNLNPNSPYSASKASADLFALAYHRTHGLPAVVTRSANNYGPYQFPEKLLSLFITNLINGNRVPLMWSEDNQGENIRDWLHVNDNCRAIWHVAQNGIPGEAYNISGDNEKTNREMTDALLTQFNVGEEMVEHIPHRQGHDFRYSIDGTKLKALGFKHRHKQLEKELEELVDWYKENQDWWRPLKK